VNVKIKVEGLKQIDQALAELGNKALAKRVVTKSLLEAAKPMQEMAQARAPIRANPNEVIRYGPKDGPYKERKLGTTRALVQVGTRLTKRQASASRRQGKDFSEVYVGTRDRAARFEEFGTINQPADPFLRPAFEAEGVPTLYRFMDAMWVNLTKAAERLAKKAAKGK
jgi:HK97 gp10 family phage protein